MVWKVIEEVPEHQEELCLNLISRDRGSRCVSFGCFFPITDSVQGAHRAFENRRRKEDQKDDQHSRSDLLQTHRYATHYWVYAQKLKKGGNGLV